MEEPLAGASNPAQAAGWGASGPIDAGAAADGGEDGGASLPWMRAQSMCFFDTDHSWKGQHWAWDNGLNDGFYAENDGNASGNPPPLDAGLLDGQRAMWFYDQHDIPFEYQLASSFAFADHYFCSVLGPTNPNRDYLMAATSVGVVEDGFPNISLQLTDNVVVSDELEQRNVTWATYRGDGVAGPRDGPRPRRWAIITRSRFASRSPTSSLMPRPGRCRTSRGSTRTSATR